MSSKVLVGVLTIVMGLTVISCSRANFAEQSAVTTEKAAGQMDSQQSRGRGGSNGSRTGDQSGDTDASASICPSVPNEECRTICHIPPGNPTAEHTITVGLPAVQVHISQHGDYLGECGKPVVQQ